LEDISWISARWEDVSVGVAVIKAIKKNRNNLELTGNFKGIL